MFIWTAEIREILNMPNINKEITKYKKGYADRLELRPNSRAVELLESGKIVN